MIFDFKFFVSHQFHCSHPNRLKRLILLFATSQAIAFVYSKEESPDSTEQCTGEEPAGCHPELVEGYNREIVPQKITTLSNQGKDENVG